MRRILLPTLVALALTSCLDPTTGSPPARGASVPVGPGMVHRNGIVRTSFAAIGWKWGGDWTNPKDYQHLSLGGR